VTLSEPQSGSFCFLSGTELLLSLKSLTTARKAPTDKQLARIAEVGVSYLSLRFLTRADNVAFLIMSIESQQKAMKAEAAQLKKDLRHRKLMTPKGLSADSIARAQANVESSSQSATLNSGSPGDAFGMNKYVAMAETRVRENEAKKEEQNFIWGYSNQGPPRYP
jgi:hypothetical protein